MNEDGYKTIIKLSSLSFLKNDDLSDPHLDLNELLNNNEGVAIFSGTINGFLTVVQLTAEKTERVKI